MCCFVLLRLFGLVSLVVSAVVVAQLWTQQSSQLSSAGPRGQGAEVGAAFVLQQAASAMESAKQTTGTYSGAPTSGFGRELRVVRADATSYCLELTLGTKVFHQLGPNGTSAPGPC